MSECLLQRRKIVLFQDNNTVNALKLEMLITWLMQQRNLSVHITYLLLEFYLAIIA